MAVPVHLFLNDDGGAMIRPPAKPALLLALFIRREARMGP